MILEKQFCVECGTEMSGKAVACPKCGCPTRNTAQKSVSSLVNPEKKDYMITLLLCLFGGGIGLHHFYAGNEKKAVLYILFSFTLVPMILSIVDLFSILSGAFKDGKGNPIIK